MWLPLKLEPTVPVSDPKLKSFFLQCSDFGASIVRTAVSDLLASDPSPNSRAAISTNRPCYLGRILTSACHSRSCCSDQRWLGIVT